MSEGETADAVAEIEASLTEQSVFDRCLDLHYTSLDSGERQYKSRI